MSQEFVTNAKTLPKEVVDEIEEYFVSKESCDNLLQWFQDNSHLKFSSTDVEELTNYILKSKEAIEYINTRNEYFGPMYEEHFVYHKKRFTLMNNTTSMITSILMCMWH